jgi:hypothetical protein
MEVGFIKDLVVLQRTLNNLQILIKSLHKSLEEMVRNSFQDAAKAQ